MMRLIAVFAAIFLGWSAGAQQPLYDPMFNASVVSGKIGETDVRLLLGPSPYISKAAADFISAATSTLDVCMYELNLPQVLDKLLDARRRGVQVRVAVSPAAVPGKADEEVREKFNELVSQKILRITPNRSGLMHNKFMVADQNQVWTGSFNLTQNDTKLNDNNVITMSNTELAENFTAEFNEIWEGSFGKKNSTPTPNPVIRIGDVLMQNYFSPEDDVEGAIVREIMKATNSIYVMAFALTDKMIFSAITNRIAAGITVHTLFDLELARQRTSLSKPLKDAGASVRISSNNGQMHHKVIVIDESVVITGSANFSASALNSNDENILIFACPPLARAFMKECARCWMAKPYIFNKWTQ